MTRRTEIVPIIKSFLGNGLPALSAECHWTAGLQCYIRIVHTPKRRYAKGLVATQGKFQDCGSGEE